MAQGLDAGWLTGSVESSRDGGEVRVRRSGWSAPEVRSVRVRCRASAVSDPGSRRLETLRIAYMIVVWSRLNSRAIWARESEVSSRER